MTQTFRILYERSKNQEMRKPTTLKKGDKIAIVTTARKVTKEELQAGIALAESWGLNIVLGKSIGAEKNQFGGEDGLRAEDFQTQLDHPEIKAIWCARGGYGSIRIIDKLDFSNFQENPKWIIGYSDVTVLHSHIHNLGIQSLHAQMPVDIENKSQEAQESIRKVLFDEEYSITFSTNNRLNREGMAKGILVGGNLSMLYSMCGSSTSIDTKDKILFIEDLDEYLYHVDRMMQNLKRNGYFNSIKALLVGGMTEMNDNAIPFGYSAQEIISQYMEGKNIPVIFDFPAGHIKNNLALPFGKKIQVTLNEGVFKMW